MMDRITTIALLGASDVADRNCRDWPLLMAKQLQIGKTSRVRTMAFGYEGMGSPQWITDGHFVRLAAQRCDIALLSFFADGSVPICPDLPTNLTNMYAAVDAIQAKRADTQIYLMKMWRMSATQEAITFAQLGGVYGQYATVVANRSNVSILDFYTPSGLSTDHPDEWNLVGPLADPIHPLLAWHQRCSIPISVAALAPLVS